MCVNIHIYITVTFTQTCTHTLRSLTHTHSGCKMLLNDQTDQILEYKIRFYNQDSKQNEETSLMRSFEPLETYLLCYNGLMTKPEVLKCNRQNK